MKVYDIRHTATPTFRRHVRETSSRVLAKRQQPADGPRKIRGKRRRVRGSFIAAAGRLERFFSKIRRVILVGLRAN